MKIPLWKQTDGAKASEQARPPRRKSVEAILRAAYRRFTGDAVTRQAVRRCLP